MRPVFEELRVLRHVALSVGATPVIRRLIVTRAIAGWGNGLVGCGAMWGDT